MSFPVLFHSDVGNPLGYIKVGKVFKDLDALFDAFHHKGFVTKVKLNYIFCKNNPFTGFFENCYGCKLFRII